MDLLPDPCGDRVAKDLPLPPHKPLNPELMFPNGGKFILPLAFLAYMSYQMLTPFRRSA